MNTSEPLFLSVARLDIEVTDGVDVPDDYDTDEKRGAATNTRLWPRDDNNNLKIRYKFASNGKEFFCVKVRNFT